MAQVVGLLSARTMAPERDLRRRMPLGRSCSKTLRLGVLAVAMHRFIDGEDRMQQALLEDEVGDENSGRSDRYLHRRTRACRLGVFEDDAGGDGTACLRSVDAARDLLYRCLNRLQSSRWRERDAGGNK